MDSLWASSDMMDDITIAITELCNEEGFVDVMTIIPSVFTAADQKMAFEKIEVGGVMMNMNINMMMMI